jgi:hypothetical protein
MEHFPKQRQAGRLTLPGNGLKSIAEINQVGKGQFIGGDDEIGAGVHEPLPTLRPTVIA